MLGQQLVNGLMIGMVYALLATGFSLAYSTGRVINFAHGEVFTCGAFLGLTLQRSGGVPFAASALISTLVVAVAGFVFAYYVLALLRSPLDRSVATIAVGLALRDGMLLVFGSDSDSYLPVYPSGSVVVAGQLVPRSILVIAVITTLLLLSFGLLIKQTSLGRAMRATAQDEELAALSGIRPRHTRAMAFALAVGLAAVAGVLIGPMWHVQYAEGTTIALKAFTASLIGGLGRLSGALIGGLLLGLMETLFAAYISSTWKDLAVFLCLLSVLVFIPRGIFAIRGARVG